jgi:hypothetical protein
MKPTRAQLMQRLPAQYPVRPVQYQNRTLSPQAWRTERSIVVEGMTLLLVEYAANSIVAYEELQYLTGKGIERAVERAYSNEMERDEPDEPEYTEEGEEGEE